MKIIRNLPLISILLLLSCLIIPFQSYTNKEIKAQSINNHELITSINPENFENETLLNHKMNVKIQLDFSIKVTSTFVLSNNDSLPIEHFFLNVNRSIISLLSFDPLGPLDFTWTVDPILGNLINITMRYPLLPNDIYVFSISYEIEDIIYKVDGAVEYYGLDYEVIHPRKSENFALELCLPVYAELLPDSPPDPVFPHADKISEENEIVKITWNLENRDVDESDVFLIRYIFESPFDPTNSNKALYYVLSVLGGIIMGSATVFLIFFFRKKPGEKELVTSLLTDTEQEVIKAINADSGVSTQRRICDKTGYSKSKVSQILAKLEEKKVLKRERWGRTNKVTITKQSFRQLGTTESTEKTSKS